VAGAGRSPHPTLFTREFSASLARRQRGSRSHSSCAAAEPRFRSQSGRWRGKSPCRALAALQGPDDRAGGTLPLPTGSPSRPQQLPWRGGDRRWARSPPPDAHRGAPVPGEPGAGFPFGSGNGELGVSAWRLAPVRGGLGDPHCWHARESCGTRAAS